jgi:hypothetical protein
VTMHCHVLGTILTPVIGGLLAADVVRRRRRGDRPGAGRVGGAALGWLVLALLSYVPLAVNELGSGGSELRAAIAFLVEGGGSASMALPARLPIVALRVLGWPLAGLITAAPLATLLAAALVTSLAIWRGWLTRESGGAGRAEERVAVRWLALGLAWTIIALAVGASSLATVVAGLPNDHYHAFADPLVVVLVAVGLTGLARVAARGTPLPRLATAVIVIGIVGFNLANQPPARSADGGWAAARAAASRIATTAGPDPILLASLPAFKSDEAVRMPLAALGSELVPASLDGVGSAGPSVARVVLCDQLFRASIGADCGGPAEDALLAGAAPLVERFEAAPGRWVSVYRP